MNEDERRILKRHARRRMDRLVYKMEETRRFGLVHWFGQYDPDSEQVRTIQDREIDRARRTLDDTDE